MRYRSHLFQAYLADRVKLVRRNRVDVDRRSCKVLEDQNHIKVLQPVLHTLQVRHFNLVERQNKEWWLSKEHERVCGRLKEDVGSERNTLESELAEGNVNVDPTIRLHVIDEESVSVHSGSPLIGHFLNSLLPQSCQRTP